MFKNLRKKITEEVGQGQHSGRLPVQQLSQVIFFASVIKDTYDLAEHFVR